LPVCGVKLGMYVCTYDRNQLAQFEIFLGSCFTLLRVGSQIQSACDVHMSSTLPIDSLAASGFSVNAGNGPRMYHSQVRQPGSNVKTHSIINILV
jgi:hypothetical protein